MTEPPLRILLADDHPVVLQGVRALLADQPDMVVVGEASDGNAAVALARELRPAIAVLDISMGGLNGIRAAEMIRLNVPGCRIIILSVHEDRSYLRRVLEVGASGYVVKRSASAELIRAIRAVAAGAVYLDPAIAGRMAEAPGQSAVDALHGSGAEPSTRELEVLRLTAAGHSNKAVASELSIGIKTVETYKARGMEKLGLRTRVELVRYASAKGWLDP